MRRLYPAAVLAALMGGCASTTPTSTRGPAYWESPATLKPLTPLIEAGAVLAGAAAVRTAIRENDIPDLFKGCARPQDGLDVIVYPGDKPGLYFIHVRQNFSRCGGGVVRVLDWSPLYAVTAEGEVLERAPSPL